MAKAPAKKAAAKKRSPKAAGGASKSEAIRQFFKANPKATGKEVVDGLKKKGINVSVGLVGNVKAKAGLSKKRKGRKSAPAAAKPAAGQTVSVSALKEAKKLIGEAGSPGAAIEAIKILDGLS